MPKRPKLVVVGLDAASMPLIRRFVDEGAMPVMKRLLDEGASGEMIPCMPAYTPTNWATIATGAYPGSHGAGNWYARVPGDSEQARPLSTFDSRAITAETIFEVADRGGYTNLIVAFPGAYPSRLSRGMIVAPLHKGLLSLALHPGCVYVAGDFSEGHSVTQVGPRPASGWKGLVPRGALEFEIGISRRPAGLSSAEAAKSVGATEDGADLEMASRPGKTAIERATSTAGLYALEIPDEAGNFGRLEVFEGRDVSRKIASLRPGQWSSWLVRNVPSDCGEQAGSMRFKLLALSADGRKLRLLRSEIYPTAGFTFPEELAREIFQEIGPYQEHPTLPTFANLDDLDTIQEEILYQVDWQVRLAGYMMRKRGWDVFFNHWHYLDNIGHLCMPAADPESPGFDRLRREKHMEALRKGHQAADRLIAGLAEAAGDGAYVCVVSDHGNSSNKHICSLPRRLAEVGLTSFTEVLEGLRVVGSQAAEGIDWGKSRAYPHGGAQICVNLRGREPHGIVEPSHYERVQEEIIDALYDWKDPATGRRPVALALKKRDAQLVGYWGPRAGDVFFVYNASFAWGTPDSGRTVGPAKGGANHGPQVPTARTSFSSNMAAFAIAGPGIRRSYVRDADRDGAWRLVDLVPTLCHILGLEPPVQSQGAVLYDIFEK